MLDMGFLPDIKRVLALLPARRQNLLFSATFPPDIQALAHRLLTSPVHIEVAAPNATADGIEQLVYFAEKSEKRALLSWLIGSNDWQQVLVFTRTKHGANRLASQLEQDGFATAAIHGNKSQAARTRALADFKQGAVRVLVATDVAARGIDISELPHVVNYEMPDVAEHYVHRIGRTGRAGHEGVAVSLVSRDERSSLKGIERLLGRQLPQGAVDRSRLANPPRSPDPRPTGMDGGGAANAGRNFRHVNTDGHRPAAHGERREHRGDAPRGDRAHRPPQGGSRPAAAHRGDGNRERQDQGRPHGKTRASRRRRAAARAGARP
jgi:ATP-dependent RNA helicase RhlE